MRNVPCTYVHPWPAYYPNSHLVLYVSAKNPTILNTKINNENIEAKIDDFTKICINPGCMSRLFPSSPVDLHKHKQTQVYCTLGEQAYLAKCW